MLRGSSLKQLARLGMAVKRGGASLRDRMGREQEAPYLGKLYDLIRYPRL